MLSLVSQKKFNGNIRELFKRPLEQNNLKAIPRDLGELPRSFVLQLLLQHQPIRLVDLWELCKESPDVPLDSAKHLRLVLKVAKLQKWVYSEKNQTDNFFYYHLHRSRLQDVQRMIRRAEIHAKDEERRLEKAAVERAQALLREKEAALDASILAVSQLIQQNVSAIRSFDPGYELGGDGIGGERSDGNAQ